VKEYYNPIDGSNFGAHRIWYGVYSCRTQKCNLLQNHFTFFLCFIWNYIFLFLFLFLKICHVCVICIFFLICLFTCLVEGTIKINFFWRSCMMKSHFTKTMWWTFIKFWCSTWKKKVNYRLFSVVELANIQVNGPSYNKPLFLILPYGQCQNFNMISSKHVMLSSSIM
jgi:hypothetical protein